MAPHVLALSEIDRSLIGLVGGKAARLGELSRIHEARVPDGFCVTTRAFHRVLSSLPAVRTCAKRLSGLRADDARSIREVSSEIRGLIEAVRVPEEIEAEISRALTPFGEAAAWAIRSSATAEDLPLTSFAGQHDSYLDVVGARSVLDHVRRCWSSLYTERAVAYRLRNGFDERGVAMAVVVHRMVLPRASGVLFTADPASGNRRVSVVEACFGLGEALVSGRVTPDVFRVRDDRVVERVVASSEGVTEAAEGGGNRPRQAEPGLRDGPVLSDAEAVQLARLGRRIESHFGHPQDIEWCLADDGIRLVQSRPITTLFPIPEPREPGNRVYVSVGHQQMMTDAMKPLGLSLFQLTAARPMYEAGGRLFVDVTEALGSAAGRAGLLAGVGRSDPLIWDALEKMIDSGFVPSVPDGEVPPAPPAVPPAADVPDPAVIPTLIDRTRASLERLEDEIASRSGPELIDFIIEDVQELRRLLFDPESHRAIMAGMEASWWLNDRLQEWLGEPGAADMLTRSAPGNVTAEMGMALLDLADVIRPHPRVVAYLETSGEQNGFLDGLSAVEGGAGARDAIERFLSQYGARCVGEIDISRPRWRERPAAFVPLILGNVRNFERGAAARKFARGREEAREKERQVLERLRSLPEGERRAAETRTMIERLRAFAGYREYPKFGMVSRYFIYRRAILEEAERQVRAGVLADAEDVFLLTLLELREVARTGRLDGDLVRSRGERFASFQSLVPPRVLTSDGEALSGAYRRGDLPAGAIAGLAVSTGLVEGRARVLSGLTDGTLATGDILVTRFTDPSWTPLFVTAGGLVTEVGGLMTHGAVIAREYGLPAVVGVANATRLIQDGDWIRVDGGAGYVQVLSAPG